MEKKNLMETIDLNRGETKVIKLFSEPRLGEFWALTDLFTPLESYKEVILDMTEMDFVTSEFVNFLAKIRLNNPVQYKKIKLINLREQALSVLEISGIKTFFEIRHIYPTAW